MQLPMTMGRTPLPLVFGRVISQPGRYSRPRWWSGSSPLDSRRQAVSTREPTTGKAGFSSSRVHPSGPEARPGASCVMALSSSNLHSRWSLSGNRWVSGFRGGNRSVSCDCVDLTGGKKSLPRARACLSAPAPASDSIRRAVREALCSSSSTKDDGESLVRSYSGM